VKLPCGRLTAAQANSVADAAGHFGSGVIEATNRSNLQLRGVRAHQAEDLAETLVAAGLGPLADGGDDIRNVMVSPTAGIDPAQALDTLGLAERLLATLQSCAAYRPLSAKFSVLLDGGEQVAMVEHPHDIWLAAMPGSAPSPAFAFGIAGRPPLAGDAAGALAAVACDDAHDLVAAVIDLFLELVVGRPELTRLRHLVAGMRAEQLVDRLARRVSFRIVRESELGGWRRAAPLPCGHIGSRAQRDRGFVSVGAVPPLGRLDCAMLQSLGRIAATLGDGTMRFTPWRSVLLPNVPASHAEAAVRALEAAGLSCRPDDPLATMIACSGSAGCASALAATQRDGRRLAGLLHARAGAVHLSGCGKSCAAAMPAPATLVGVAPDRYDLFVRDPDGPSRFGRPLAHGIGIAQAAALLAGMDADRRE
jgi:precorrin-3B synthase